MSLQRIAQKSKVSVATVSRVINSRSGPSQRTVKAVREAMEQLGYTPPPPSMRTGRPIQEPVRGTKTGLFATLLFGFDLTITESPFNELVRLASKELSAHGYTMVLDSVSDASKIPAFVARSRVDGILCIGSVDFTDDVIEKYSNVPTVWMMHAYGGWGDHVLPDSEMAGRQAAELLLMKGHKNVAYMTGVKLKREDVFKARYDSFKTAAEARGMNVAGFATDYIYPERFAHNRMDFINSIHRAYKKFLEDFVELDPMPTAIYCPSDVECSILYRYLREADIVPGRDVEVVGCGNFVEHISTLEPIPASFDLNIDVVAKRAVEQLLWRVDNFASKGKTKILVEPELVLNENIQLTNYTQRQEDEYEKQI